MKHPQILVYGMKIGDEDAVELWKEIKSLIRSPPTRREVWFVTG